MSIPFPETPKARPPVFPTTKLVGEILDRLALLDEYGPTDPSRIPGITEEIRNRLAIIHIRHKG